KDVVPGAGTELRCWAREGGGPLLLEAKSLWRGGQAVTADILLEPTAPITLGRQAYLWKLPHLVPTISGKFTGSYVVTLDRSGGLVPPGVTVVHAPGTVGYPNTERAAVWAGQTAAPEFYWQVTQPSGGEMLLHDWEPTYHATLLTSVADE